MKTRRKNDSDLLRRQCLSFCLAIFALLLAAPAIARAQQDGESPNPILISQPDSTRALMAPAANFRGTLPRMSLPTIAPGDDSRAVLFVTNFAPAPDESANALRIYAEDAAGKTYRLSAESIAPLRRQPWIYAIVVRFYDDAAYNGQPQAAGDALLRLTWRGLTSNRVRVNFGEGGKEIKDDEDARPTPAPLEPLAAAAAKSRFNRMSGGELNGLGDAFGDRARFMEQAAFGPTAALDLRIRQIGIQRWLNEQFVKPYPTFAYPDLPLKSTDQNIGCPANVPAGQPDYVRNACNRDFYTMYQLQRWQFNEALYGDDQLRRRVSWALSQIWVVSGNDTQQARWELEYIKVLDKHAFGNYRDLMKEMTLNPAMGNYLDMVRSTRRSPNENYPREILQLFSIGLDELNLDGTPKLQNNARIPTYDQEKINQFTKIFTGWTLCQQAPPACPNNPGGGIPNYIDPMIVNVGVGTPTASNPGNHDISAKSLFDYPGAPNATIAACANCLNGASAAINVQNIRNYAADSLDKTLDNIYNHPNVAPFVSKLLIQHLVTSDPSPAFVQRVATVFNQNRTSQNQMAAVAAAILLDPEARGSRKTAPDYGKLREPFQLATNLMRQFRVKAANTQTVGGQPTNPPAECGGRSDGNINGQTNAMAQNIWYSPTVFNYYSPEYVIPGTDQLGPEFAILDTGTAFRRINFVNTMIYAQLDFQPVSATNPYPNQPCGTALDLSEAQAWAAQDQTGNALVDGLNRKMMYGTMSSAFKQKLLTAITAISATGTNAARDRARQAVYLIATSSQYQVQK